ncbi:dTDP-4-dehydrorhamnose reductase [Thermosipho melanesiensis]|uniref:dTDP-4-dehydrorhamnose reductase n=2 Tax=Thermosipho melanesiensis TaxID=46541 RepID=A6LLY0_THEM4|nr:dTDP-4-dehydrorhamnose reductase [Thermosipho melanesiensis]ABR30931.1 dTDP-4-dehydrorhamnose reductase [Thermosipho melanesiensis BI429]APT74046.1 dTDP-4-dehydrorhamnose reductase [Thermosipho melanesiensis]OOC35975.1 dTDP-4-dehydrorhamnose reductase [Thermosipho melanesiensis]OOC38114.1 dTDP-4-dehydrorhamnose reductase [Thermosipho melanesiensis]OOC38244.1 dTDP-4-dehydrorhamnose reductase [Thermosipho melanesiensis]
MRILITGAYGQLGQDFQKLFDKEGIEYIATDNKEGYKKLDITNLDKVIEFAKKIKPDVIINCAAYNAVDKAEEEWKVAYNINGLSVRNLAIAASLNNSFLVHYSTDYVFDGRKGMPYTIYDTPNPLSKYGESKYLGEKLLSQFYDNYALIRTSWVFGKGNINFAKKVIEWSKKYEKISLVIDEISAPTYTVDLAKATWEIIKYRVRGLYHISNERECSRYEYGRYILERIGYKGKIEKAYQKDFNLPAKRPKYSKLDNFGLCETVGFKMPDWKEAVDRFLKEIGY